MDNENEIILYQPNNSIKLEVCLKGETVWLTQAQIAELFGTGRQAISKHLKNIFHSEELKEDAVCSILELTAADGKTYKTKTYNLDAILSVGYRVNSKNATLFRQWANKVLKDYLLRGYAINRRLERLEKTVADYDGQIFDAYAFATDLIKSAKENIVLIDNYVDESTLLMLSKRTEGVTATVYTGKADKRLLLDLKRHNEEYPPIELAEYKQAHDRFLLIDTDVYHIGASLKDLGKKWFAFSRLHFDANELLERIMQTKPTTL